MGLMGTTGAQGPRGETGVPGSPGSTVSILYIIIVGRIENENSLMFYFIFVCVFVRGILVCMEQRDHQGLLDSQE